MSKRLLASVFLSDVVRLVRVVWKAVRLVGCPQNIVWSGFGSTSAPPLWFKQFVVGAFSCGLLEHLSAVERWAVGRVDQRMAGSRQKGWVRRRHSRGFRDGASLGRLVTCSLRYHLRGLRPTRGHAFMSRGSSATVVRERLTGKSGAQRERERVPRGRAPRFSPVGPPPCGRCVGSASCPQSPS